MTAVSALIITGLVVLGYVAGIWSGWLLWGSKAAREVLYQRWCQRNARVYGFPETLELDD